MAIMLSMSAQAFERFGFWTSQNPNATQEQKQEKLTEIKATPIKGYVTDFEQKMEDLRLRHEKIFVHNIIQTLKKRLKKEKMDKKVLKEMLDTFKTAVDKGCKEHWEEGMQAYKSLSQVEKVAKTTKSVKEAERNREKAKKMVDDLYAETLKMISDLPPASSFNRPTGNDDISDAEIIPPKAETAPEADTSNNNNNKPHKKS